MGKTKWVQPQVRSAFTYVEMLIVITMLSVLLSLIVPSLAYARRAARTAACLSNVRQLRNALICYATSNNGRSLPFVNTAASFWEPLLSPNKNVFCGEATTLSNGIGTATTAWGPNAPQGSPWMGNNAGSYGINGWIYQDNQMAAAVFCKYLDMSGNTVIKGNVGSLTGVLLHPAFIQGNLDTGGALVVNGGGAVTGQVIQNDPNVALPDVVGIYNSLVSSPSAFSISGGTITTLDFSTHSLLVASGSVTFQNNLIVKGSGTLVVNGSISSNGATIVRTALVCTGTFMGNAPTSLSGSLYAEGDITLSGNSTSNARIVTLQTCTITGATIVAAPAPSFDPFGSAAGYMNNIIGIDGTEVPAFADAIWPEAWPAPGDAPPVDPTVGNYNVNLDRFYISRHGNSINVGFLDGHAETVPLTNLPNLTWSNAY